MQSPVLKGHLFYCHVIENFIWIEPLKRPHFLWFSVIRCIRHNLIWWRNPASPVNGEVYSTQSYVIKYVSESCSWWGMLDIILCDKVTHRVLFLVRCTRHNLLWWSMSASPDHVVMYSISCYVIRFSATRVLISSCTIKTKGRGIPVSYTKEHWPPWYNRNVEETVV